jgi:hypothetical protein
VRLSSVDVNGHGNENDNGDENGDVNGHGNENDNGDDNGDVNGNSEGDGDGGKPRCGIIPFQCGSTWGKINPEIASKPLRALIAAQSQ